MNYVVELHQMSTNYSQPSTKKMPKMETELFEN